MSDSIRLLWFSTRGAPPPDLGEGAAFVVATVSSLAEAEQSLEQNPPRVALLDWDDSSGSGSIEHLARAWPEVGWLVVATDDRAATLVSKAAVEFLTRPFDRAALRAAIDRAAARAAGVEHRPPPLELRESTHGDGLVGSSPALASVREVVARLAQASATVLVRGETGTGKELVAQALHRQSQVGAGPFIAVHAAALPEDLLESELFGYEKGAFTGATGRKPGRVEFAQGGTLFLDEVAEISPRVQAKLLRLLQEREFTRLGGTRALHTDARFVAATHRDLEQMVARGEFRQDLFYRLNVMTVWLPPLRARRDDIQTLAEHFLRQVSVTSAKPQLNFEPAALRVLRAERWPGNVRQLLNFVERLAVLATDDTIREADVQRELQGHGAFATESSPDLGAAGTIVPQEQAGPIAAPSEAPASSVRPLRDQLQRAERAALIRALERAEGNRTLAARLLGVGRRTLYTKLEEHGLL